MSEALELNRISQMHQLGGLSTPEHPLVSVIHNRDIKSVASMQGVKVINNLYAIIFKSSTVCGSFSYGRNSYDHEEGTLVFTAPGQVMEFESDSVADDEIDPDGWTLVFHPDLFRSSDLSEKINKYSFFHYDSNEALHISDKERLAIEDLLEKNVHEYSQTPDRHSQNLIVSNIELFLDYCLRFYDRQFFSRTNLNGDVISKFEAFLVNYYETDQACDKGVPSVEYCAKKLNYSPNYFSDLLKKETRKTALEQIHFFLIERAKNSLLNSSGAISGVAYSLGFEFPQRFSNFFKSKTGMSPKEYRNLN
ncbi:MAG: helix-turn-helix transcriptional regulator [Flavobacteriales bacterium]|nr:helix-turn-helix transcriptional regulator [Flavobacteriales bacterium]